MTRRLVETMYPISKSSSIWDRISGVWSWILNYFGLAKNNTKADELGFDLISSPWHLLNIDDGELVIISRSFAVAWAMSMKTWKVKEFIGGRCDVRVNVEIPEGTVLAAPLDGSCVWRQARGSAAEVSMFEKGDSLEEKVGVAQQWFDELDNLAFANPEFESLESSDEVDVKSANKSFEDTGNCFRSSLFEANPSIKFQRSSKFAEFTES